MLFTTLQFGAFLAICLLLYYILPHRCQWFILLMASLAFYSTFGVKRMIFILASAASTWLAAQLMAKVYSAESTALEAMQGAERGERKALKKRYKAKSKLIMLLFLCMNIGGLFVFKFYNVAAAGLPDILPTLNIFMPLGISFYTLQIAGYIIDVYNKKVIAEKSLLKTMLFTMFFLQIIEGPIGRFAQLQPQLCAKHSFNYDEFAMGAQRILWGYFKKLVIADRLNILVNTVFASYAEYEGLVIAVAAVLYTVQLYADFSGGIDIACGAGEMFGIHRTENFNRPFFSKSISEFWRRWHITLGTWLRDYVFYPLTLSKAMSKTGKLCSAHLGKWAGKWVPAYISLLVLWLLNGVWHGSGWQYIAFGLYHGILIIMGMSLEKVFDKICAALHINRATQGFKVFRVMRTFALVVYGELIFRSASLTVAAGMTGQMLKSFNPQVLVDGTLLTLGLEASECIVGAVAIGILLCASLLQRKMNIRQAVCKLPLPLRWTFWLGGIFTVVLFGIYGPSYDPTPFIYFKF